MVFRLVPHSIHISATKTAENVEHIVVRATCRYHFGEPEIKKKKDSMFGKDVGSTSSVQAIVLCHFK